MTLQEQIEYTEEELKSYTDSKFASPTIIDWLQSILISLNKLL